jgi:hypothetical protein
MMNNQPIKCASKDYTIDSFYLLQIRGTEKRYVIELHDKIRIRTLLAGFINNAQSFVQLKIRDLDNANNIIDYSGEIDKKRLHNIMTECEDVIFHNGYHDLMIRNPKSGDYVVFDEHGLIFIYTDEDYTKILKNLGAEYRPNEKLIYQYEHWHYLMPNGREKLAELIGKLELEQE